jgi:hypothetical protein
MAGAIPWSIAPDQGEGTTMTKEENKKVVKDL